MWLHLLMMAANKHKRRKEQVFEPLIGNMPRERKPPDFPMPFKVFLRDAFGGRLYAERLRMFRKFLRWFYQNFTTAQGRKTAQAPEILTDSQINGLAANGVSDPHWYFETVRDIQGWRKENRVQQRHAAINSRWIKYQRKKLLRVLENRLVLLRKASVDSSYRKKRQK